MLTTAAPATASATATATATAATPGLSVGLGWRHPHYARLLAERPALAFLEVHSENFFADGGAALEVLQRGRALYPVSLHGVGLSLGSAVGLDDWHLAQLARLVERIDPVRVSDHASFARGPWAGQPVSAATQTAQASVVHAADLLPIPWTHEALAVMAANVQRVQERLRRPIAVENLSAYLSWAQADFSEPDFLTELARRTGCHLLVDVNNLMVNALNAHGAPRLPGEPGHASLPAPGAGPQAMPPAATAADTDALVRSCCAWLDALGRDVTVAEIHLAGHVHAGDIVIDDHGSRVSQPVWRVHAHALRRWGAVPALIEWDTDIPELDVLLAEVALAEALANQVIHAGASLPGATA